MKLIEVKITIDESTYNKWNDYYKGGETLVAKSLHDDIKKAVINLGITDYLIESKITETSETK